ncbi:hypothetical protein Pan97_42550 [Bremerella volcania]|uniref:Uncharacterized protein n=1 Tax=Bremerella volcania TaxID=2527984 RepID=A0A518CD98_9BACT|nr:hypothetical protein Pan97_42550 [Bremerella volcania]
MQGDSDLDAGEANQVATHDRGNAHIMPATGMIAEHVGWLQPDTSECHRPSLVRQADEMMAVRHNAGSHPTRRASIENQPWTSHQRIKNEGYSPPLIHPVSSDTFSLSLLARTDGTRQTGVIATVFVVPQWQTLLDAAAKNFNLSF